MLYFAYGSNLSIQRLHQRIDAAFLFQAYLTHHDLRFHKVGQDGSAKCDVYETGLKEDRTYGVVYRVSLHQRSILDRYEGLGQGYDLKSVEVNNLNCEAISVQTYVATDIDPGMMPFCWYRHHVIHGATDFKLPFEYCRKLQQIQCVVDSNQKRHRLEMSVYEN